MTVGLSNVATEKMPTRRGGSTRPFDLCLERHRSGPAESGDSLQSAVYCDFETVFESATLRLTEEQRYRTFVDLKRIASRLPCAVWHSKGGPREVTIWCSNDYLGMSQNSVWRGYRRER